MKLPIGCFPDELPATFHSGAAHRVEHVAAVWQYILVGKWFGCAGILRRRFVSTLERVWTPMGKLWQDVLIPF